ncbi:pyrophosphatase PpaX [Gorillibacterium sp. sgz5001074]|uniref:pyrophosphatase PpaX n=1 Tax=Gorillibacterium sp. sgz5001074 TaxID=3446695 RepID=UPI003F67C41A
MFKTVLFDLDGTILDTNELIVASFLHTLEGVTEKVYTREDIVGNFGRSLIDQMREYTGQEDVEPFIRKYRTYNISRHDELIREFPYVRETVERLSRGGIKLGVVTSKVRRTTLMGLERFGLKPFMGSIVTVDEVSEPKPSPEGIRKAMEELGAEPATTLMVGDSQYDIQAAKRAGIRVAGVRWTEKGEEFLRQFEPDFMIADIRELIGMCGLTEAGK